MATTPLGAYAFDGTFGNSPQTITGATLGVGDIVIFTWGDFGSPATCTVDGITATSLGTSANGTLKAWLASGVTHTTGNIALGATLNLVSANWWLISGLDTPTFTSAASKTVTGTVPSGGAGIAAAFDSVGGSNNRNPAGWTGVTGSTTVEAQALTNNGICCSGGSTTTAGALTAVAVNYVDTVDSALITLSATGGTASGTLATTEAPDALAFTGTYADPLVDGLLVHRRLGPGMRCVRGLMPPDLAVVLPISGTMDTTEGADVLAFTGNAGAEGTLTVTDTADTLAFTGNTGASGTLTTTETADALAFTGNAGASGTLSTTEAQDVAALNGPATITGTMATTESVDVLAFNGPATITGTMAVTEGQDILAFNDPAIVSGTLAVTEATDVLAFQEGAATPGTWASFETPDTVAFTGNVGAAGTLTTTEAQDGVALTGNTGASGTLTTTEAIDVAALTGNAGTTGTWASIDTQDTASFTGSLSVVGTMATTDTADGAAFTGNTGVSGTMNALEGQDTMYFYEVVASLGGGAIATPVVTVPFGGIPVVDNTLGPLHSGAPISEAAPGRGTPVTKVTSGGTPVQYTP